jgi:hypothetical protein
MRFILFTVILLLCQTAFSQSTVKGAVKDTADKRNLRHTVISLLKQKDSFLVRHTRAGNDGLFEMKGVPPGKYLLLISYPQFVDYTDTLVVEEGKTTDVGAIAMTPKARMLEMAVVRQKIAAIRWKGDTLVFKADSFNVKDDATVEDLLKKFPGFQVDRNGTITAGGKKVEKVLVDGEEFFGDDPTIATRSLDARSVNEVELFEKKSDQAAFTGIDDGKKTTTLNLKLKEDRKKGYYTKLQVGSNGRQLWDNNAMVRSFTGKRKISVYGIMSRTGKTGLDFGEMMNYGGGGGVEAGVMEGGGMYISVNGDGDGDDFDWGGRNSGAGLPKSWSGGVNYSNKWNNDKLAAGGSYTFGKVSTPARTTSRVQYLLPDTSYYINSAVRSFNSTTTQKANFNSTLQIDSATTLKLNFSGGMNTFNKSQTSTRESLNSKLNFVNDNDRQLSDKGDGSNLKASALLMHKFKKLRRTFSLNLSLTTREQQSEGFLYALTRFYNGSGGIINRDTVDQKRENSSSNNGISTTLTYTEPVTKNTQVSFAYGYSTGNSQTRRKSFDKVNGKYENLNTLNSVDFDFKSGEHTLGAFYSGKIKKFNYNMGNNFIFARQKRTDNKTAVTNRFNFVNINPNAYLNYNFNKQTNLSVFYDGNTSQPSPEQLQPNQDNTDPLNIVLGNSALKPSFQSYMSARLYKYNADKGSNMSVSVNYNTTRNAILSKENFDAQGRRISQFINIKNGNYNIGINGRYGAKFRKKSPWRYNLNASLSNAQNTNFINGLSNTSTTNRYGFGTGINYDKDDKWNFGINGNANYNQSRSSIGAAIPDYWTYTLGADLGIDLPWKFELNSGMDYNYRQKTSANDVANSVALWTAGLDKKMGKKGAYKLGLHVNDILNQNIGFNRSVTPNGISESTYDTFQRYWMLRFTWNFAKNGKPVDW